MKQFRQALCGGVLLLLILLSGCAFRAPDKLYTLPQQSDTYRQLQEALEKVIVGDTRYCAPTGGENRQAIQMQDLNGDGRNEAIVLAKSTGEHPLKIYIFARGDNGIFSLLSSMEGDGTGYDSIAYAEVDGSPGEELIVGRSLQDRLHTVTVYSLQNTLTMELVTANDTAYRLLDMDGDGRSDLFLLRPMPDTGTTVAELYRYKNGALVEEGALPVTGAAVPKNMLTGTLSDGTPAVFVGAEVPGGSGTSDVFLLKNGEFRNLGADNDFSYQISGSYAAYPQDIDDDGTVELPDVLYAVDSGYQIISWYAIDSDAQRTEKQLTYHDFLHGFYLELEESWRSGLYISIQNEEDGIAYRFECGRERSTYLFTVYLFNGDTGVQRAQENNRFLLMRKNDISYAVETGSEITPNAFSALFRLIGADRDSGEL